MSRKRRDNHDHENGFPRVSGDEPFGRGEATVKRQFSPRERG